MALIILKSYYFQIDLHICRRIDNCLFPLLTKKYRNCERQFGLFLSSDNIKGITKNLIGNFCMYGKLEAILSPILELRLKEWLAAKLNSS